MEYGIYQGTTPVISVKLSTELDLSSFKEVWVTFKMPESGRIKTITMDRLEIDNEEKIISLALTQEETLAFTEKLVKVQVRLLNDSGAAYASSETCITIGSVLDRRVME